MLAIVAYRQPIARSGIELIRGIASDSAITTLLECGLIAHNSHHLFVTTPALLDFAGLRDLSDLPPLSTVPEPNSKLRTSITYAACVIARSQPSPQARTRGITYEIPQ